MSGGDVYRKESKRWVAPQNSYDGDDWGDEYDDDFYGNDLEDEPPLNTSRLGDIQEAPEQELHISQLPHAESKLTNANGLSRMESKLSYVSREKTTRKPVPSVHQIADLNEPKKDSNIGVNTQQTIQKDNTVKAAIDSNSKGELNLNTGHPTEISNERPSSAKHDVNSEIPASEEESEDSNSIQDIYGFYENRYSTDSLHMKPDFSESTASLSTGVKSFESASHLDNSDATVINPAKSETRSSSENHTPSDPQVKPLSTSLTLTSLHERPYSHVFDEDIAELYTGSQEFLNRPISTYQAPEIANDISSDSIRELLTPSAPQEGFSDSGPVETAPQTPKMDLNAIAPLSVSPSTSPAMHSDTVSPSTSDSKVSGAETEGSSRLPHIHVSDDVSQTDSTSKNNTETLNHQDVNSNASVYSGLAPHNGENNRNETTNEVPSFIITSASPERSDKHREAIDGLRQLTIDNEDDTLGSNRPIRDFSKDLEYVDQNPEDTAHHHDFSQDLDYVDKEPEDAIGEHKQSDNAGLLLRNELDDSSIEKAVSTSSMTPKELYLPSDKVNETASENDSEKDSTRESDKSSPDSASASAASTSSSFSPTPFATAAFSNPTTETNATGKPGHRSTLSQSSALTGPPITSKGPIQLGGGATSANLPNTSISSNANAAAPSGAQPERISIASKVKRPPHVDFGALMHNSNVQSDTLCDQLRSLRNREAAYSAGLETWLVATLQNSNHGDVQIYTNGIPPAADPALLDIPTSAKMSNAMHTSATKTQEKLGNLGEKGKSFGTKSRSFFAKVIR